MIKNYNYFQKWGKLGVIRLFSTLIDINFFIIAPKMSDKGEKRERYYHNQGADNDRGGNRPAQPMI